MEKELKDKNTPDADFYRDFADVFKELFLKGEVVYRIRATGKPEILAHGYGKSNDD